jgi:cytochrome c oxidase assembly protein Cox11
MRENRKLAKNVWYKVETAVNVSEPLFQLWFAVVLLYRVLCHVEGSGVGFAGQMPMHPP